MNLLIWNPNETDPALHETLQTLSEEYPLREGERGETLVFRKTEEMECLRVSRYGNGWEVEYGREDLAARGAAYALSGQECSERIPFRTHGILFDCTRGNVITVEHFKFWLRRLSLMGYNMAMIYVKDAYQLPGEPYFGYMRGAYSMEEIREIDAYARKLKIEMIASIQALGHMEPILRWPTYNGIRDTADVLLVDEPKTCELIEKILTFWSSALTSRRIHLGMDETKSLGRGKYLNLHGYRNPFELYNRHLRRVCEICERLKLRPIIWSDMYFCFANRRMAYYDTETVVPEEVRREIPKTVQLSYWDYYSRDEATYETMLRRTQELNGNPPFMASGIWTWALHWTDFEQTFATVRPCIAACRKTGVRELIYTLWGDDGGYCDFDSALAGLAWAADCAFNRAENHDRTARFYHTVCGSDYDLQLLCGGLSYTHGGPVTREWWYFKFKSAALLWDDPIMGIVWKEMPAYEKDLPEKLLAVYSEIRTRTEPHRGELEAGSFDYVWNVANVLILKIRLRKALEHACGNRNAAELRNLVTDSIPEILEALDALLNAFRIQWNRSFKPFGMELMQIRLGGQKERYRELARRISELLEGKRNAIDELEQNIQPAGQILTRYAEIATGGFFL